MGVNLLRTIISLSTRGLYQQTLRHLTTPTNEPTTKINSEVQIKEVEGSNLDEVLLTIKQNIDCEGYNFDNLKLIVTMLAEKRVPLDKLRSGFVSQPQAARVSIGSWTTWLEGLHGLGFTVDQSLDMIFKIPTVFQAGKTQVLGIMDAIQTTGLSSKTIVAMISDNPRILFETPVNVRHRIEWLRTSFTNKDVAKLCRENPTIFFQTEEELYSKIQYMVSRMGLEQPQMRKSSVWGSPLFKLRVRHELLERAGLYVKPNPKLRYLSKNPSLSAIMDKSDKQFATMVANVSPEEYELFSTMAKTKPKFLTPALFDNELGANYDDDADDNDDVDEELDSSDSDTDSE